MTPTKLEFGSATLLLNLDGITIVAIEKKLNKSLFQILMTGNGGFRMPKLGEMLTILHEANTSHGIKASDMTQLYNEYIADGNTMMKLLEEIQNLMKKAGFFEADDDTDSADLTNAEEEDEEMSLI